MQALKQYIWLVLLMGAGAVIAWFVMPPQRRNTPGLFLACATLVAILVFSGCRRTERTVQPDKNGSVAEFVGEN
jgi:hypothetical protein